MQGNRDVISDRRARAFRIVVSTPSLQLFARIRKGQEPVGVQAFGPELAVERLDEAIVGRLARPREVQSDLCSGIRAQVTLVTSRLIHQPQDLL